MHPPKNSPGIMNIVQHNARPCVLQFYKHGLLSIVAKTAESSSKLVRFELHQWVHGWGRVEEGEGKTDTYRSSTAGKDGYGYHFTGDNLAGI